MALLWIGSTISGLSAWFRRGLMYKSADSCDLCQSLASSVRIDLYWKSGFCGVPDNSNGATAEGVEPSNTAPLPREVAHPGPVAAVPF